jgi:hypothetical protein
VVSYDNGDTWKTLGLTSDTDYSAYIDPEQETDDYIVLVVGATSVQIPKEKAFTLVFPNLENNGVQAGETAAFPYTIAGVNAADETDVDVIGIIGDWTAEVVPTDNASGVLNVTATESASAKISVYAANHKGKTDIRTLLFEGGILEAVLETEDVDWEGGNVNLTVTTNLAYDIVIPEDDQEWITVASTRVHTDYFEVVVAKNETGSYRTATLKFVNENGETIKAVELLQYANPEVATDLASVVALPDDKAVLVNSVTVVAASKTSTIITDGEAFSYVAGYTGTPGTVIDIEGTKKTDDYGLGYIEPAEVTVNAEAQPASIDDKDYYMYYGAGDSYFFTSANGTLEEKEGVYYMAGLAEPQQFIIEAPTQDVSALVGKLVAMSGWVKTVDYEYGVKEDIITVITDIREVVLTQEAGWTPYYAGAVGEDPDYPEIIGNEVANPQEGVFYSLGVFSEEGIQEYGSLENLITAGMLQVSDDMLFYGWYYSLVYDLDFDTVFSILAHQESAEEEWPKFDYGKFYLVAVGLDADGCLNGKYAVTPFEKENPYTAAAYEDFLGEWTYSSASGKETWVIKEKENGKTYTIEGIAKADLYGGGIPVAEYDAENGTMTISQQTLGSSWTYDYQGTELVFTDCLTSTWYNSSGDPKDNSSYMLSPLICTGMKDKNDGHIDLIPDSDEYGPLEGIGFFANSPEGYTWNYYAASKLPGSLTKSEGDNSEIVKAAYGDFVGQWNAGGTVLQITANSDNATYSILGFPGYEDYAAVIATYDETDGTLAVMEQDLGDWTSSQYGACFDFLGGVFSYGGKEYTSYPFNSDTKSLAFKAQLKASGNMVFAPGSCAYGTFVGVNLGFIIVNEESEYYGYGSTNDVFYLDELAKPVSSSSAFNAPKTRVKKDSVRSVRFNGSFIEKAQTSARPAKQAQNNKNERTPKRRIQF